MTLKTRKTRLVGTLAAVVLAVTAALVVAGCGSSDATSPTPSPTPSSIAERVAAMREYLAQVKPITTQVGTTMASLPNAVKGLDAKPGASWTAAAANLDEIATQLGDEADSLSAVTPPAALQPTQDAAVEAIQSVQKEISDTASFLNEKVEKAGTTKAAIEAQLAAARAKLVEAGQKLLDAVQALIPSTDSTPTP